ncbi:MAG: hypothetical protein E7474_02975 [Ruminococcaceae bacterium]|nr:hypothetical protein [Oscillospiraceae bacterium]
MNIRRGNLTFELSDDELRAAFIEQLVTNAKELKEMRDTIAEIVEVLDNLEFRFEMSLIRNQNNQRNCEDNDCAVQNDDTNILTELPI